MLTISNRNKEAQSPKLVQMEEPDAELGIHGIFRNSSAETNPSACVTTVNIQNIQNRCKMEIDTGASQ